MSEKTCEIFVFAIVVVLLCVFGFAEVQQEKKEKVILQEVFFLMKENIQKEKTTESQRIIIEKQKKFIDLLLQLIEEKGEKKEYDTLTLLAF